MSRTSSHGLIFAAMWQDTAVLVVRSYRRGRPAGKITMSKIVIWQLVCFRRSRYLDVGIKLKIPGGGNSWIWIVSPTLPHMRQPVNHHKCAVPSYSTSFWGLGSRYACIGKWILVSTRTVSGIARHLVDEITSWSQMLVRNKASGFSLFWLSYEIG